MIYNHLVKYNGVYYPAGTDVPVGVKPVEEVKKVEEVEEVVVEIPTYSKTEINRMSTADLKELAKEQGIDDDLSGAEIKKALIAKFGL
jgi:hypothetical protein